MPDVTVIHQILDLARWAPSGDNTQPWRFEIVDASRIVVHGFDTREHCVYDLDGHPSQISIGALLETMSIAATSFHLRTTVSRRPAASDSNPIFDVQFAEDRNVEADPLVAQIPVRSVQRRPMSWRPLSAPEKDALERSIGAGHRLVWLEGLQTKARTARLMFANAKLRLTMPEAYRVHRDVIEWGARFSTVRVPDQALGVDPLTARLMRWIMVDWNRVTFFNRYLAGTLAPRIQMDLLPGMACAAHFVLVSDRTPAAIDDYVAAGRAVQRFWLTLSSLGLLMQPELTPLIFDRYVRDKLPFSSDDAHRRAGVLAGELRTLLGEQVSRHAVFMGRVGAGKAPAARSTRLELRELMVDSAQPRPAADASDESRAVDEPGIRNRAKRPGTTVRS